MLSNLLTVLVNGLLAVADTAADWLIAVVGLVLVVQFARWEIALDRHLGRGFNENEELL